MSDRAERIAEKIVAHICASLGHTTTSIPVDAKSVITKKVQNLMTQGHPTEKQMNSIVAEIRKTFPNIDQLAQQPVKKANPSGGNNNSSNTKAQRRNSDNNKQPLNSSNIAANSNQNNTVPNINNNNQLPSVKGAPSAETMSHMSSLSPGRYPAARVARANRLACDAKWANQISEDLQRLKDEEEKRQQQMHEKRLEQRKLLDQQVMHRKEEKDMEEYKKQLFAKEQEELRKKWEEDQNATAEAKRKVLMENQAVRQALLEERRRKIEQENKIAKEEGKHWANQINDEVRQEEQQKREKKRDCMLVFKKFITENNDLAKVRKDEASKEKQHDKEVLMQYAELLEQQEKKGALERAMQSKRAQVVVQKQAAIMQNMEELQKKVRDEQRKRDEETEKQLQERFEREKKLEEQQRELRKKEKQTFIQSLENQLQYKQTEKSKEHEEVVKLRKEVDSSTSEWQRAQDEQKKRIRMQREMSLKELEEQTMQNIVKAQNPLVIKV
eukprot:PhF_6_TR25643/c0_g1_i1/m.36078